MLLNRVVLNSVNVLLIMFALYLFSYYFDMFFTKKKKKIILVTGYSIFIMWQLILLNANILPVYINISITIVITFISAMLVY